MLAFNYNQVFKEVEMRNAEIVKLNNPRIFVNMLKIYVTPKEKYRKH